MEDSLTFDISELETQYPYYLEKYNVLIEEPIDDPVEIFNFYYDNYLDEIINLLSITSDIKNPIRTNSPLIKSITSENPAVAFCADFRFKRLIDIISLIYKGNVIISDKDYEILYGRYGTICNEYVTILEKIDTTPGKIDSKIEEKIVSIRKICKFDVYTCGDQKLNFAYDIINIYFDRFYRCISLMNELADDYEIEQSNYIDIIDNAFIEIEKVMNIINPDYLNCLYELKDKEKGLKLYNFALLYNDLEYKNLSNFVVYYEDINYIHDHEDLSAIRNFIDDVIDSNPNINIKKKFENLQKRHIDKNKAVIRFSENFIEMFNKLDKYKLPGCSVTLYAMHMYYTSDSYIPLIHKKFIRIR